MHAVGNQLYAQLQPYQCPGSSLGLWKRTLGGWSNIAYPAHFDVFSDGSALELATVTGSVGSGLTATLTVAV